MTDRAEHAVNRQTSQAMATLGRTVWLMYRAGLDPAPLLAAVERACREAEAQVRDAA